jgi:tryptophan synthase alpha chain
MQPHEKIGQALKSANDAGRTGLVPFITAGYPDPDTFIATLKNVASVGDVVELGIPFSDPMADGMTIQRSSYKAIENGVTLRWIFEQLKNSGSDINTPLVMMSYLNPLLAYGYDKLAESALQTGVCAFIVPDLPFEESEEINVALAAKGIGLIQLVTPATPDDRMKMLCEASRGFTYAVTVTGITGGGKSLPADLADYLDKAAALSPIPVCAGFGIRSSEDVENVGKHVAGAIVGSALVEVLERGEEPVEWLIGLRSIA